MFSVVKEVLLALAVIMFVLLVPFIGPEKEHLADEKSEEEKQKEAEEKKKKQEQITIEDTTQESGVSIIVGIVLASIIIALISYMIIGIG